MSAVKSKPISGYDSSTEIVTFGDSSRKMLSQCTKNELIAVANFGGIKFRGKPAMHFSPLVIESAIKRNLREIHYSLRCHSAHAPLVPSVPPVIPQPTVSAGSVDGVIESIVNNAVKLPSAITVAVLMRTKCGLCFT
jgi:hypothetical protein